jgi:recombination protein RecT
VVLDALARNPDLLTCTPNSIVRAAVDAAEVGLELASPRGEAYLVPFNKKGVPHATMMIGYRGFIKLIRQAPRVEIVKATIVRAGDVFEVDEGNNKLTHLIKPGLTDRERGDCTFVYSRVWYTSGMSQFEVMDRAAVNAIQAKAQGKSPWRTGDENAKDEMRKKCPLRRQAKWLELSQSGRRGQELDSVHAMIRGEEGAIREGFETGRAQELKDMLGAQTKPVDVIDADFEEVDR